MGGEQGSCGSSIPCRPRPALQVLGNGGNGLLAVDLGPASAAGATGGTPVVLVEGRRPVRALGWACWVAEGVMGARPDRSDTFGLGVAMPFRAREGEVRRAGRAKHQRVGQLTRGVTLCVDTSFFFCSPSAPLVARRFRRAAGTWRLRAPRPGIRPRSRAKAPPSISRATTTAASKAWAGLKRQLPPLLAASGPAALRPDMPPSQSRVLLGRDTMANAAPEPWHHLARCCVCRPLSPGTARPTGWAGGTATCGRRGEG